MQHRVIFVALFSCILASAFSASIQKSSSSEEVGNALDELFGGVNPMEMKIKFSEFMAEQCRNQTGSDEAFESIKTAPDTLTTCALNAINIDEIMEDVQQAVMTDKYDPLFIRGCNVSKTILPCIDDFIDTTSICMDEEDKQVVKIVMIIVRALLDFTCSRSLEELESVLNAKSDDCFLSKEDQVLECFNSTLMKYFDDTTDEDKIVENLLNLLTKEENCVDLVALETCTVPLFSECTNRVPIELARDVLRSIIDQTPCKGMKENPANAVETNEV